MRPGFVRLSIFSDNASFRVIPSKEAVDFQRILQYVILSGAKNLMIPEGYGNARSFASIKMTI